MFKAMLDKINSSTHDMERDRKLLLRTVKILFFSGMLLMCSLAIIFTIYPAQNRPIHQEKDSLSIVGFEKDNNNANKDLARIDHASELVPRGWGYAAIDGSISMWTDVLTTARVL